MLQEGHDKLGQPAGSTSAAQGAMPPGPQPQAVQIAEGAAPPVQAKAETATALERASEAVAPAPIPPEAAGSASSGDFSWHDTAAHGAAEEAPKTADGTTGLGEQRAVQVCKLRSMAVIHVLRSSMHGVDIYSEQKVLVI